MKLNLGCGFRRYDGFVNVDRAPECKPDVVWNLEQTPWPWKTDSVEEIKLEHVLEHLGESIQSYLDVWKEMYRICQPGAEIFITVPHWRHDNFHHDPTHVRAITPEGIRLFDQETNAREVERGERGTKLGLFTGIDIDLPPSKVEYFYTQKIADEVKSGALTRNDLEHLRDHQNNISNEIRMVARVIKPSRGASHLNAQRHDHSR